MLTVNAGKLGDFLLSPDQVTICADTQGRKVTLGEGGFGLVYKGVMNGVDEVAVKVARVRTDSLFVMAIMTSNCIVIVDDHLVRALQITVNKNATLLAAPPSHDARHLHLHATVFYTLPA